MSAPVSSAPETPRSATPASSPVSDAPLSSKPPSSVDGQRQHARQSLVRFTWYRVLPEGEGSSRDDQGISRTCDVSLGGLGLRLTRPLAVGAKLFLEMALGERTLSAVGMVMHARPRSGGGYRIGVKFLVMPPNDVLDLEALLSDEPER
jgi:hypothetical protein